MVTVPREEGKKGAVEVEQRLEGRRELLSLSLRKRQMAKGISEHH